MKIKTRLLLCLVIYCANAGLSSNVTSKRWPDTDYSHMIFRILAIKPHFPKAYPRPIVQDALFTCFLQFLLHRLPLAVEGPPLQIGDNAIPNQSDQFQNLDEERRAFYGVLPPSAGVVLSFLGFVFVGWGWWNIRFSKNITGWKLIWTCCALICGLIVLWHGFESLAVWSLSW